MASLLEDPSSWRLRTSGGIPYKLLSVDGSFEHEKADVNLKLLIQSSQLFPFCVESFPPPITVGNITVPQYAKYAGTNLGVKRVQFKSFDEALPVDPFNTDSAAPSFTYFPVLELNVEIGSTPFGSKNPADPFTFLEISAEASGEFIHSPPINMNMQDVEPDPNNPPAPVPPPAVAGGAGGALGAMLTRRIRNRGTPRKIRTPYVPHTVLVPQTTWSVGWKRVNFENFYYVIRPRLEDLLGKVNSEAFQILYAAWPETLLFIGYSFRYNYTWRDGYVDRPFIDLELKFLEKRVLYNGVVRGHQDVWLPGTGWVRLVYNRTGGATYDAADFNTLFAQ